MKSGFRGRREELPIPAKPLPLCPHCNYNLTGLTSRICPECGRPFTVQEARAHGFKLSKEGRSAGYRGGGQGWWPATSQALRETGRAMALLLGAGMTISGFFAPSLTARISPRAGVLLDLSTKIVFKIMITMATMIPVDALIAAVGVRRGYGWTGILLVTGVATLIVGSLIGFM